MDPATGGTDWSKLILQILGVAGGLTGLASFFLRYANPADKVERWVGEDQEYRRELAEELRGGRLGGLYQHTLGAGLDWLDRCFGAANSAKALSVSFVVSLCYAYAAFFLAWGVGGPGNVAGVEVIHEGLATLENFVLGFVLAVIPFIAFALGKRLHDSERRLRLTLRRSVRRKGGFPYYHFDYVYTTAWVISAFAFLYLGGIMARWKSWIGSMPFSLGSFSRSDRCLE